MTYGDRDRMYGSISLFEMNRDDALHYRARITALTEGLNSLLKFYQQNNLLELIKSALSVYIPDEKSGSQQGVLLHYTDELLDCYRAVLFEVRKHPDQKLANDIRDRLFKYEDNYPLRFRITKQAITK